MKLETVKEGDFHIHSLFSDGANTYDELVTAAGRLGLPRIAITDHSDEYMRAHNASRPLGFRHAVPRWRNVINEVEVKCGLEMDLLTPAGDISDLRCCGKPPEFTILSVHSKVYSGNIHDITGAYLRAIDRYADKIDLIGHPCLAEFGEEMGQGLDIEKLVRYANDANIGLEVNGASLCNKRVSFDKLRYVCQEARILYANSDAHVIWELEACRARALSFLAECGRS